MAGRTGARAARRAFVALGMGGVALAGALAAEPAAAQTWAGARQTPRLTEIVAIDATGEESWLYGSEDVAGDGLGTFQQQEQSIDIRTAYATADAQRLWARVYASAENAVGGNVTVFVFVDADRNALTGGTAEAPEIDPKLGTDTSPGGYEFVIGVRGNGSVRDIWEWQAAQSAYAGTAPPAAQAVAEVGQDEDPILIGTPQHGYVQAMVDLALVGLTAACDADLYFRSIDDTPALGAGDLEVGQVAPCIPADANNDNVPDIVVPPGACSADGECPGGGICEAGTCVIAAPCVTDADCGAEEQCSPDGRCVPRPTGTCSDSAACGDLVCVSGQCGACTLGGDECGPGRRCAPTGVCIDSSVGSGSGSTGSAGGDFGVGPDEAVRGGACACRARPAPGSRGAGALVAAAALAWMVRRRPRRGSRSPA